MEGTVWQNVLFRLQADDLIRIARVNRDFYRRARANAYWRRHMQRVVAELPQVAEFFSSWASKTPTSASSDLIITVNRNAQGHFQTPSGIWRIFARRLFAFYRFRGESYNNIGRWLRKRDKWIFLASFLSFSITAARVTDHFAYARTLPGERIAVVALDDDDGKFQVTIQCAACGKGHRFETHLDLSSPYSSDRTRYVYIFFGPLLFGAGRDRNTAIAQFNCVIAGGQVPTVEPEAQAKKQKTN
jgi:hypothetical protein